MSLHLFSHATQHNYRVMLQTTVGDKMVYIKAISSERATDAAASAFVCQYPAAKVSKVSATQLD